MKTKVVLVQLPDSLFLAGADLGKKLIPNHSKGTIGLYHDSDTDHVIVEYKGQRAHIKHWWSFNEETSIKEVEVINKYHPQITYPAHAQISGPDEVLLHKSAQVSTPQDKVQGKSKKIAKFQGEQGE